MAYPKGFDNKEQEEAYINAAGDLYKSLSEMWDMAEGDIPSSTSKEEILERAAKALEAWEELQ